MFDSLQNKLFVCVLEEMLCGAQHSYECLYVKFVLLIR